MVETTRTAILALEDGTVYRGRAFGARATHVGEAVFNTSMTGYQEILTDPSYYGQIVAMTAPQVGNTGVNALDNESDGPKVAGFVVRELSPVASSWRAERDLPGWLAEHRVPAITGVDTRALTRRLRSAGAMKACLSTEGLDAATAVARARAWPGLVGVDYVREVTTGAAYAWDPEGALSRRFNLPGLRLWAEESPERPRFRLAAFDFGAKLNIFRNLRRHGFDVTVVPATATADEVRALRPDAVFLSNGPGDPAALHYAHEAVRALLPDFPMFGICLGHQIISHALGGETFKLKFGHRGGNQPVRNDEQGRVAITSQNHGFATQADSLEGCGAVLTEVNLNDRTVSGLRLKDKPVFSVQYHPEASPGPHDSHRLFEDFYQLVAAHKAPGA